MITKIYYLFVSCIDIVMSYSAMTDSEVFHVYDKVEERHLSIIIGFDEGLSIRL